MKKKKVKEEFFTAGEEFSEQINSLYEDVKKIEQENNLDVVNKELEENKLVQIESHTVELRR